MKFTEKFNNLFDKFTTGAYKGADSAWLAENVPPPKFYSNVCANHPMGSEYSEYENSQVMFGPQDDYEFTMKLGRGRYSEVFRAVDLLNN